MKPIELIGCVDSNQTMSYLACKYTLRTQMLSCVEVCDQARVMELLKGKANPLSGFVLVDGEGVLIGKDIFDLVHWIEEKGWRVGV